MTKVGLEDKVIGTGQRYGKRTKAFIEEKGRDRDG